MKLKKLASLALAGALTLGLLPAFSSPALAADGDTSYTITIPSTLNVANSGWNATDGISATGTLESGKKLTVTVSSANSWALKSDDNSIGYKLATASSDTEATTSWEFTELSDTATTKPMGIIVEDYSTKPAGTYQDTVTFTAKVEDAKTISYKKIGSAIDTPQSLPANFTEVTLEEATAYGQSYTGTVAWLIIYAKDGDKYKFVRSSPEMTLYNGTQTWDKIVYGESGCYHDPEQVSILAPVTE